MKVKDKNEIIENEVQIEGRKIDRRKTFVRSKLIKLKVIKPNQFERKVVYDQVSEFIDDDDNKSEKELDQDQFSDVNNQDLKEEFECENILEINTSHQDK